MILDMNLIAQASPGDILTNLLFYAQIFIGFSFIIFFHELGHFLVAKWAGVRVERFAVGFFREVFGFTRGETRYSFNILPLGGYVKMLGQEDFEIDTSGELQVREDPRSFANKSVGKRMAIVSAGVIMNVILAGILFMIVFMAGMRVETPRIGAAAPDFPAFRAGLGPGDEVLSIDGEEINEFKDISMAVMLAKPGRKLDFEIKRGDQIKHIHVEPKRDTRDDALKVGIAPAQNNLIHNVGPEYHEDNPRHPRPFDKVVEINGQPVNEQNANEMMNLLFTDPLGIKSIVVSRPDEPLKDIHNLDFEGKRVEVELVPRIQLYPAEAGDKPPHLLGMAPATRVSSVTPDSRAEMAGLKENDIIVRWDDIAFPSQKQIADNMAKRCAEREVDIVVEVRRTENGKSFNRLLEIRPKVKVSPITRRRSAPDPGAYFSLLADDWLVVGQVVDTVLDKPTPASLAKIPPGALITHVNDEPVQRWIDLVEALRKAAGEYATLTYELNGKPGMTAELAVPRTVRTVLGLGPESSIIAVAGEETVDLTMNDRTRENTAIEHPWGLRTALQNHVGQTVEIKFRPHALADAETATITIEPDMVEPWVGLVNYSTEIVPGIATFILKKDNPIAAIKVGAKKTYYFVYQVYQVMERMIISRSLSMDKMSGPVGILKIGRQVSEAGWTHMLYFLAIISANLAVINFLPLPIVDGGLMVFLLIEKIKGSPVSIKVQVATQVIGLILIASAFIAVTIQDLAR